MCLKSKAILLSALFACLSVVPLHSQSQKDTVINLLSECQTSLLRVKLEISESQKKIISLQSLIDSLNQQLTDSKNSSQIAIDNLRKQLTESESLLTKQREDLKAQEMELTKLSQELKQLKTLLGLCRSLGYIASGIAIGEGVYILGHCQGWWK